MTFSVHYRFKFKNFVLKKFFMIFQNGRDMCPDIYKKIPDGDMISFLET